MTDPLFEPRVRWLCRRGMKEVEELLFPFFEARYPHLSTDRKSMFVQLLEESDPNLYAWLMRQAVPAEPNLRDMVDQILSHSS